MFVSNCNYSHKSQTTTKKEKIYRKICKIYVCVINFGTLDFLSLLVVVYCFVFVFCFNNFCFILRPKHFFSVYWRVDFLSSVFQLFYVVWIKVAWIVCLFSCFSFFSPLICVHNCKTPIYVHTKRSHIEYCTQHSIRKPYAMAYKELEKERAKRVNKQVRAIWYINTLSYYTIFELEFKATKQASKQYTNKNKTSQHSTAKAKGKKVLFFFFFIRNACVYVNAQQQPL